MKADSKNAQWPQIIEPFEIEQGINDENSFDLCIEIAKRYNNYDALVSALHNAIITLEAINEVHKSNYGLTTIADGKNLLTQIKEQ